MRRRIVALLAMVVMLSMLAASAPVFAQGLGGSDTQPGQTEKAQSPHSDPPLQKPGDFTRSTTANDHDPSGAQTGFGKRVQQQ